MCLLQRHFFRHKNKVSQYIWSILTSSIILKFNSSLWVNVALSIQVSLRAVVSPEVLLYVKFMETWMLAMTTSPTVTYTSMKSWLLVFCTVFLNSLHSSGVIVSALATRGMMLTLSWSRFMNSMSSDFNLAKTQNRQHMLHIWNLPYFQEKDQSLYKWQTVVMLLIVTEIGCLNICPLSAS